MASAGGRALLCVVAVLLLLLVDGTAARAAPGTAGLVGESMKLFYLRGNPVVASPEVDFTEEVAEEKFETFARRELDDGYGDPTANCDTNHTNCP